MSLLNEEVVHGTAAGLKNDELLIDAMALQMMVSTQTPPYSCYHLSFSARTACNSSGHCFQNGCFAAKIQQT
jgi:hypothetical protein